MSGRVSLSFRFQQLSVQFTLPSFFAADVAGHSCGRYWNRWPLEYNQKIMPLPKDGIEDIPMSGDSLQVQFEAKNNSNMIREKVLLDEDKWYGILYILYHKPKNVEDKWSKS